MNIPVLSIHDLSPGTIQFLDYCQVGIIIQDANGKIVFANKMACTLFKMKRERIIGKYSTDDAWHMIDQSGNPIPGEDHPSMRTLRSGKPLKNQIKGLLANDPDRMRWLKINTHPFKNKKVGKPEGVVITFSDITSEVQTEQALKESEQRFDAIFKNMKSGVAVYQAMDKGKDFVFIDFNKAAEKITKIKRKEAIGHRLLEKFPNMVQTGLFKALQTVYKTGKPLHLAPFYYKDDIREGWRENYIYKLKTGEVVAIFSDVTEQQEALETIKKLKQEWEDIFQSIGHLTVILDDNFRIVSANRATIKAAGVPEEELIGKHCYEIFHHTNAPPEGCPMKALKDGKAGSNIEMVMEAFGGIYLITCSAINVAPGDPKKYIHIATDITREKKVLEEFKYSEERLKALSDSTFEAVFFSDKGICIDCNKAAEEMFGYSREELLGIFGTDVIAEEYKDLVKNNMLNKITTPYQALAQRKDGSTFWAQFRGKMFPYRGKEIRITAVIDINEQNTIRNHLEEIVAQRTKEIEQKNQQLESSQVALTNLLEDVNESREELQKVVERLTEARDELESFSYSVSHDLKAPLRAIDGFSHILAEEYAEKLDKQGQRYLKTVRENTQFMGTLIQDLLDFSRAGRSVLHPEAIESKEFVADIVNKQMALEKGRKISVDIGSLPDLVADKTLLNQVFHNLISNAIKFTRTREHARIEIKGEENPNEYLFSITDNGVGFDMKYITKLFNVFQRLHTMDEYEGTGVGLALVKRIVKKLGGDIQAQGKADEGASFTFTIPKFPVAP
jgi:PAS domain S-box-containing protein